LKTAARKRLGVRVPLPPPHIHSPPVDQMPVGDIVRVNGGGEHAGRYGQVTQVNESGNTCTVQFEDDLRQVEIPAATLDFVRRGPFRGSPR
jgi:hypothetical protein